jgi:plasmid stability protein
VLGWHWRYTTVANIVARGVPDEVLEAFRARAAAEGRTMKYVLIQLMARWVLEAEQ